MLNEKTRQRLEQEPVIWLTTVSAKGQPQTSVVWFLLEDHELLIYSLADTARIGNIETNPKVALNLDGNGRGGSVVTIEGSAAVDANAPRASQHPGYVGKYLEFMKRNGWTPDEFSSRYPVPIRIRLERVRAW